MYACMHHYTQYTCIIVQYNAFSLLASHQVTPSSTTSFHAYIHLTQTFIHPASHSDIHASHQSTHPARHRSTKPPTYTQSNPSIYLFICPVRWLASHSANLLGGGGSLDELKEKPSVVGFPSWKNPKPD